MAGEKTNLTEEQRAELEEAIREHLKDLQEQGQLDEGLISTLVAKTTGAKAGLAQLGKNAAAIYRAIARGETAAIRDPKVAKNVATAVRRIQSYEKKFTKMLADMTADLEFMFGDNFEHAPELQQVLGQLDDVSTKFAKELGDVGKAAQAILTKGADATVGAGRGTMPEPAMAEGKKRGKK